MAWRPIFYDTETTGINAKVDRVVEIAAYDPERDKTFCQLVNPQRSIPVEAAAVHKITEEMVADAPTFAEIIDPFAALQEHLANTVGGGSPPGGGGGGAHGGSGKKPSSGKAKRRSS